MRTYHHTHEHAAAARALRGAFTGGVHLPGDEPYDRGRLPWNRRFDPRPVIVAEAAGPADVRAAVLTAREHGLPFAVQATGHGTVTPADGGLLLKTSRMASVRVDPRRRTATAGPGALWSDVITAAAPFGLAPLSGTPSIGVTGYTLGGGTGWLSRKYGFAADSLVRAEVVTSAGEPLTVGPGSHPDLFWALRGGSGNFAVVTALEFRLYPVTQVYAGMSLYPIERAAEALACYRDRAPQEPDELNTAVMLLRMPADPQVPEPMRGRALLAIRVFHLGSAEDAERRLAPLLETAGPALVDGFASRDFAAAGTAIAGPPPPPMASGQHIDLFRELPDGLLATLVETAGAGADAPAGAVELRHWGGAMGRPAPDAGPAGHRDVPFSVIATASFDGAPRGEAVQAHLDGLAARMRPYATGGSFLNFLSDPARTPTAYTEQNYARLAQVKRTWDPDNVFHGNHNIPPA
ncbi:FAD-binding oxidoreductase [Actinomadura scrupuli]|uniref:FAD-binding oxidoreductase n=1 Tax=Actinomadura scrupuli TaxID=559629 RepID=UPI003D963EE9